MALFRRTRSTADPRHTPGTHMAIIEDVAPASDRALLITLRPGDPGAAFASFDAGAHIDVHIDDITVRQYSLVGADTENDRYRICVQREPAGRGGSIALHRLARQGSRVLLSTPRSGFRLADSLPRALLLGGGVGVTPLVSMAERLHREGRDFSLHAYGRDEPTLPLHEYLTRRPYTDRYVAHLSAHGDSFRTSSPVELLTPPDRTGLYVCGPAAFIEEATTRALAAGWPEGAIFSETFAPAPASTGAAFTVVAASTGQRMTVGAEDSIADVMERNGYDSLRSCGQGFCGSCVTRVISGLPDHRDDFQSDQQRATNAEINVCVSRSLTPELELDI